jgi:transketolase
MTQTPTPTDSTSPTLASTPQSIADQPRFDCRDAYVETLIDLAEHDHRIVGVVNDSVGSSKLDAFKKSFPDRLINVGIAEQDMVGVAAGLATGGRIPFVSAAASFLTARALEQIKVDAAYSDNNIKLCGMSPGMAYGELGPTHHSVEDLAWLRAIDNLTVLVPADPVETAAALRWAAAFVGPVYLRISRMPVPAVNPPSYEFTPGRAVTLRPGTDVTLISHGTVVWRALAAAEQLATEGISARVLSFPSVDPLDVAAVLSAARETRAIVTAEEATAKGGLGSAVAEVVVQHHLVPMTILGVTEFAPTGSAGFLLDRFGMSPEGIARSARDVLARAR